MQKKLYFLAILTFFLFIQAATAQNSAFKSKNGEALKGVDLSLKLKSELEKKGFLAVQQNLAPTGNDIFPFNILVSFPANSAPSENTENESPTNLVISFTQEEASEHFEKITDFLKDIKKMYKECAIEILFSASDLTPSFENTGNLSTKGTLNGTKIYSKNVEDITKQVALAIRFGDGTNTKNAAYPGSKGDSSPSFLVKMLFKAFDDCDEKITIQGSSLSLYRLKILSADNRMQSFMEEGIPAISVMLSDEEKLFCIEQFIRNFKEIESTDWDRHYSFFFNGRLFLSERFFVLFFLIVLASVLFLLFAFSFVGKDRHNSILEFLKTVYLLPITILVSFLALVSAQEICVAIPFLKNVSVVAIWTLKIALAVALVTVIFVFQERFFGRVHANVYGYIMTLAAIINIIVFSTIDLSFLFVFFAIYIVIYFSRSSKNPLSLIIFFFLMLFPFYPYARNLLTLASDEGLRNLVICSPLSNLVLALALFPHLMIYLEIFHSLKILQPEVQMKKRQIFIRAFVSLLVILGVLGLAVTIFFFTSKLNFSNENENDYVLVDSTRNATKEKAEILQSQNEFLSVTLQEQGSVALNTQIIRITTKKPALKVGVKVFGIERSPVYNADYDFEINEKEKSAIFLIPDQPPQTFSISFISSESFYIELMAYFEEEDNKILLETFRSEIRNKNDNYERLVSQTRSGS